MNKAAASNDLELHSDEFIRETVAPEFDERFYLNAYPDVVAAGITPLDHFLQIGWYEGRNPHPEFSTLYYLEQYPEVAAVGMNPFYHWILSGMPSETIKVCSTERMILVENTHHVDPVLQAESWNHLKGLSSEAIAGKISEKFSTNTPILVLAFGHDNYMVTVGGVQLITALDQKGFEARGNVFLQLHPVIHTPLLLESQFDMCYMLGMVLNGEAIGICRASELKNALTTLGNKFTELVVDLVVHALLGHSVEFISQLKSCVQIKSACFWIHDYYSICSCYNLLRNNIIYCHAPNVRSAACCACVHGEERVRHLALIQQLFETYDFTVIAPSQTALNLWLEKSDLPHKHCVVKNHLSLSPVKQLKSVAEDRELRVAFLGLPRFHKGWETYSNLVQKMGEGSNHRFYLFGKEKKLYPPVDWVAVEVLHDDHNEMSEAIKREQIDVVVIWSVWPETFCIAAYEAMAAGCFIVTNVDSGNVAAAVRERSSGLVLSSEDELIELFADGEVGRQAVRAQKRGIKMCRIKYNELTAGVISSQQGE